MCDWGADVMVRLCRPMAVSGRMEIGVDACIASLVQALNDAGIETIACCCGHGKDVGRIDLADGRALFVHLTERADYRKGAGTMNLDTSTPLQRAIYNMCLELEKLPASPFQTRLVTLLSDANAEIDRLRAAVLAERVEEPMTCEHDVPFKDGCEACYAKAGAK